MLVLLVVVEVTVVLVLLVVEDTVLELEVVDVAVVVVDELVSVVEPDFSLECGNTRKRMIVVRKMMRMSTIVRTENIL